MSAAEGCRSTDVSSPLALPTPPQPEENVEQLSVNGTQTFKFDALGPVVVNTDGVRLSRAAMLSYVTVLSSTDPVPRSKLGEHDAAREGEDATCSGRSE